MANRTAVLDTTQGVIKIELFEDKAPNTAQNFIDLVEKGFYNGLTFHRYVADFVIQGELSERRRDRRLQGPGDRARAADSARSRHVEGLEARYGRRCRYGTLLRPAFRLVAVLLYTLRATTHLDNSYAVFGRVTEGWTMCSNSGRATQ